MNPRTIVSRALPAAMIAVIAGYAPPSSATPPEKINIQGVLREDAGGLQDGLFTFRVRLIDGDAAFYDETYPSVVVESGVFSLDLDATGAGLPLLLQQHPAARVEITVDGEVLSAEPLGSSPYALYCGAADSAINALQLGGRPAAEWVARDALSDADPATAPVSWKGLTSFPSGCPEGQFAVGFDDATGDLLCDVGTSEADITSVTAGSGLLGGGASGALTLGVDPTVVQARVSGACAAGFAVSSIDEAGQVACEATGITSLNVGPGLSSGGTGTATVIEIDETYVQRRVSSACAPGSFITGIAADGSVTCDPDRTNSFTRTLHVPTVPGDAAQAGQRLVNAVADASDATAQNPYLIKLEPGTYDLGTSSLALLPYVDIEGAGRRATVVSSSFDGVSGTIVLAGNNELRALTVDNRGGGTKATAVSGNADGLRLVDVVLSATAPSGLARGLDIAGGTVELRSVTVSVSGAESTGVNLTSATLDLSDVIIGVAGAVNARGLACTQSSGHVRAVRVTAIDANTTIGVVASQCGAEMTDVSVVVTSADSCQGYLIELTPSPRVTRSSADVSCTNAHGVLVGAEPADPLFESVTLTAAGGPTATAVGLYRTGDSATFRNSSLNAPVAVQAAAPSTFRAASTLISGTLLNDPGTASFVCAGAFNAQYVSLNATCQ
ncbi:MAG: hypothetical protein AB2A00_33955 [Myxococcota bacterium]